MKINRRFRLFVSLFLTLLLLALSIYSLLIDYKNNQLLDYGVVILLLILYIPTLIFDMKSYIKNNENPDNLFEMPKTIKELPWTIKAFVVIIFLGGLLWSAFKSIFYILAYLHNPDSHLATLVLIFLGLFSSLVVAFRRLMLQEGI